MPEKSWPLISEEEYGDLTPEEAASCLRAIRADGLGDDRHPLSDRNHVQAGDYWRMAKRLQAIAEPGSPPAEPLTDDERKELEVEIAELEATPGYVSGELKRADRAEHDRTLARVTELYRALAETDASAAGVADDEVNMGDASG